MLNETEFSAHKILRLGPYSPMLNPIEYIWSVVKANVKSKLAESMSEILDNETRGRMNISEFRLSFLEKFNDEYILLVDATLCCNNIVHIQTYVSAVLSMEDMSF